jgi:hypothetical protein
MKIIRVFPRKTKASPDDPLAKFGPPNLFSDCDQVHISVAFTYDMAMLYRDHRGAVDPQWKKFQKIWARPALIAAANQ